MENYIHDHFIRDKSSINMILKNERLVIDEVIMNEALTVVNIFWSITSKQPFENKSG